MIKKVIRDKRVRIIATIVLVAVVFLLAPSWGIWIIIGSVILLVWLYIILAAVSPLVKMWGTLLYNSCPIVVKKLFKTQRVRRIAILSIAVLLWCTFVFVDYRRVSNVQRPIFSIPVMVYRDGGTAIFLGVGYWARLHAAQIGCAHGRFSCGIIRPWFISIPWPERQSCACDICQEIYNLR